MKNKQKVLQREEQLRNELEFIKKSFHTYKVKEFIYFIFL